MDKKPIKRLPSAQRAGSQVLRERRRRSPRKNPAQPVETGGFHLSLWMDQATVRIIGRVLVILAIVALLFAHPEIAAGIKTLWGMIKYL